MGHALALAVAFYGMTLIGFRLGISAERRRAQAAEKSLYELVERCRSTSGD